MSWDDPEARGGAAVDHDGRLLTAVLLIAADVDDLAQAAQALHDAGRPGVQIRDAVALQRELVLRVARSAADSQILHRL
jgi:hypothetical protein